MPLYVCVRACVCVCVCVRVCVCAYVCVFHCKNIRIDPRMSCVWHLWYISRGITQAAEWDETSPCTIKHGLFHKMRADSQPANFHVVEARKRIELSSEFYFYTWDQHECMRVRENVQVSTQEYVTITYVHYMTNVIYVAREERTCELCTCGLAWTCTGCLCRRVCVSVWEVDHLSWTCTI